MLPALLLPILFILGLGSSILAAPLALRKPKVDFTIYDRPGVGTPAHYFTADSSIPVKELAAAALAAKDSAASYLISADSKGRLDR